MSYSLSKPINLHTHKIVLALECVHLINNIPLPTKLVTHLIEEFLFLIVNVTHNGPSFIISFTNIKESRFNEHLFYTFNISEAIWR